MLDEINDVLIDSSFYSKFMNKFIYNYDEEEIIFGIKTIDLKELKIKKNDILTISFEESNSIFYKYKNFKL